jgi:hypothetical protein
MSWQPPDDPECPAPPSGVELVIVPRAHDLGGFEVRRALPAKERQMVGPFIFFDQMGRANSSLGRGSMSAPIRISAWPPSPICSTARSCIGTAWALSSPSYRVT